MSTQNDSSEFSLTEPAPDLSAATIADMIRELKARCVAYAVVTETIDSDGRPQIGIALWGESLACEGAVRAMNDSIAGTYIRRKC